MPTSQSSLLACLPQVRGRMEADVSLKDTVWFHTGGAAEVLFQPRDEQDLTDFLKNLPANIPVTVLGLGSNVIVRDGGIPGVTIRFGQEFRGIKVEGDVMTAGAAAVDAQVSRIALNANLTGLEFLSGIPGSIGGGLIMNAGAYGREFKDVVVEARAIDRKGNARTLSNKEMGFSYRHADAPEDFIFVSARLKGMPGDAAAISAKMKEIQDARGNTQPIKTYTGGSTFANPANPQNKKAWELIDAAGCRGLRVGGAEVSTQHCNFLINRGGASAADLEKLGELVREKVKAQCGIDLRWEIRRIGMAEAQK